MLRSLHSNKIWVIPESGTLHIGRDKVENQMVLEGDGVSRKHATIFWHWQQSKLQDLENSCYVLEDFSSYGTWVSGVNDWQRIHR
jgi:pSer/pThr/pTyr-binding forkhead associated (FHA) protein